MFAAATLAACTDERPGSGGPYLNSHVESYYYPQATLPMLDAVIVVDDTTAMAPHTANAGGNLAAVLDDLLRGPSSPYYDLHLVVATSGGVVLPMLTDAVAWDGTRTTSYSGTLDAQLSSMLGVGATRSGANEPLRALVGALATPDLIRENAFLSMMVLSASDDDSPMSPTAYATAVKATKPSEGMLAVGVIDPDGSGLLDLFGSLIAYSVRDTLETVDYATSGAVLPVVFRSHLGVACGTLPLDLDPIADGGQYDCSFTMLIEGVEQGTLAACSTGVLPCWEIVPDPLNCFDNTGRFVTHGFPGRSQPSIIGQCVVQ